MALIEKDLAFISASVTDLKDYLFSAQLYWPLTISPGSGKPRESASLTPGNLLLAIKRLRASPGQLTMDHDLESLFNHVDYVRERWRSNWRQKCGKEFQPRLGLWQGYLRDLSEDVVLHAPDYHQDVRWRAILHLLRGEIEVLSDKDESQLEVLDNTLRSISSPASFVWEEDLAAGFPQDIYWFLYVSFVNKSK